MSSSTICGCEKSRAQWLEARAECLEEHPEWADLSGDELHARAMAAIEAAIRQPWFRRRRRVR
jgi:hypothetical protein